MDSLTMLRGLLALAIIWHHLQPEPIASMTVGGVNLFFLISFPGRISVWLFMVISGYSIYHGYRQGKYCFDRQDTIRFYFNRAVRILPLFYVTVLMKWIVMNYLFPEDLPPLGEIVRTLLLIDFNMLDGIFTFTPTWVIAILVQFYLLAPLLAKGYHIIFSRVSLWLAPFILIAIAIAGHLLGRQMASSYDIRNIAGCVPLFLFGFLAYDIRHDHWKEFVAWTRRLPLPVTSILLIILFEVAFFIYQFHFDTFLERPMEAYIGFLGAVLIIFLQSENQGGRQEQRAWGAEWGHGIKKLLCGVGNQSYGLYMWHGIIITLVLRNGFLPLGDFPHPTLGSLVQTFLVVSILTYLVSVLFYHIIERPYHLLYWDVRR